MSKLISAVSQIQLADQPASMTPRGYSMEIEDPTYEPLAFATLVTATHTPNLPLRICPQTRDVNYQTTWHNLRGYADFGICSWCFNKYIGSSQLTHEFDSEIKSGLTCRFNVPRITKSLWPDAKQTGKLGLLRDYISRRPSVPACTKAAGAVGADGVKWFGLAAGELGMVACEACHEDIVLGTAFAGRFCPLKQIQGASERWTCTISYTYVSRALQILSRRKDQNTAWTEVIEATRKRMALPICEGKEINAIQCNWYRPKQSVADLDFCETCYLDQLAMTPYADDFADTAEGVEEKLCMRACDLQLINLGECVYLARTKGLSVQVILEAAAKIASSPRCFKGRGITDGKFYNFKSGSAANYGVCEACHAGILVQHGVEYFFGSEPQLVAGTAWCAFNPSVARFNGLVDHWQHASETGYWGAYETWVKKYAALPVCPNFNLAAKSKWHGWQDCTICPECYGTAVEGTSLAASMELHDVLIEGETLCCMYSDRMRGKYKEACEAGDATELRAFCRKRWETYQQTVPRFKMIYQTQGMQSAMAMSNMMLSMSYQHANAMSDWVTPSGYEYGNSSVGYHSSQYGVDSAEAWNKGQAGFAQARGGVAEASYLKDIWQAVE
ncbi:hypothetical protein BN1723_005242 [Verticillium longisporum]|uniref:Integral membrane protein n=2 Tax=Verticillium longisporum TaxID=100787 RepID=A0A0G4N6G8_VERLO|nr:hypothetical protein BN1723_005242 [Verticillium longisporum]